MPKPVESYTPPLTGPAIEALAEAAIQPRLHAIALTYSGPLFHGSNIASLQEIKPEMRDYLGCDTLGPYVYYTDDREAGINYAVCRAQSRGGTATLYTASVHDKKLADLSNSANIALLIPPLVDHLNSLIVPDPVNGPEQYRNAEFRNTVRYLSWVQERGKSFDNLRQLFECELAGKFGVPPRAIIYQVGKLLNAAGFDGFRCPEGGEVSEGASEWRPSMTYVLFNHEAVDALKERAV